MKNKHIIVILLVHLLLAGGFANAQSPNAIPYQSVVRNSVGNVLASQPIKLRISIHDVIPTGTVVYSETHAVTTTSLGLINVNIGQGTIISGTLAGVNWGTGAKFMQVEFDPTPPSTYIDMGTTQLNSVPYALYTSSTFQPGTVIGQMLYWNGSTWLTIPPGAMNQVLTYSSNGPVWQTPGTATSTTTVSNIQGITATCGGNIITSITPVIARGVCWSTSPNPTIYNSKTIDGTGFGSFVSNLTGLTPLTTYYVRAYAINGAGIFYGNEISFITQYATVPTLTTSPINSILGITAISGGSISYDGNAPVTARGVCWSTSPSPTIYNSKTIDGTGTGIFVSNLAGLTVNTTYYVRAFATNILGTAYGNEISFTTFSADIGLPYQGGILAYFLQPGDPGYDPNVYHGLIAGPGDLNSGGWGCSNYSIQGADGFELGTGNQNTIDIMAGCSAAGIAARQCGDLVLGGYSDWYLPSLDELGKLYLNRIAIGGFANTWYWSSTEHYNNYAWYFSFITNGYASYSGKDFSFQVRAVRAF